MNRNSIVATIGLITVAVASGTASAQQACPPGGGFCEAVHYDYFRNKMWPMPFRAMDSSAVLSYFDVQRNNGWRLHNTMGAAMFDASHNLTDSGRAHLKWIIARAPQNRRVVFILEGNNQAETARRVESTQLAISEFVPVGALPSIYLTDQDAPGSSGVYQTAIARAMTTSVPAPRLPASTGGGGATGTP